MLFDPLCLLCALCVCGGKSQFTEHSIPELTYGLKEDAFCPNTGKL